MHLLLIPHHFDLALIVIVTDLDIPLLHHH